MMAYQYDRPGDIEQARRVDTMQVRMRAEAAERQARQDAERVFIVTVTNTRTGASVQYNSRSQIGWYRTEDGQFLATLEDIDPILRKWHEAGESQESSATLTGKQFRESEEKARLNP